MSSHVEAAGVYGSSGVRGRGTEDAGGENGDSEEVPYTADALCLDDRPWLRSTGEGEGGSAVTVQLVRPALPGRKAHRKTRGEDRRDKDRGGLRERNQDRKGESVESVGVGEHGRERQSQGSGLHRDGAWGREGKSRAESLSSSNSDSHQSSVMEVHEASGNLQRGPSCPRPHSIGYSLTTSTGTNPGSPRPATSSMSPMSLPQPLLRTRPTPQRLSPRTGAGELHRCPPQSSRHPDPFWVEVRTRAGFERSSQSRRTQTRLPSLTGSELGEEEEGEEEEEGGLEEEEEEDVLGGGAGGSGGVTEAMTQTLTPAVPASPALFAERRLSKREKNRMKCLRRRQRRRERWRQSQLQESRQVNHTKT